MCSELEITLINSEDVLENNFMNILTGTNISTSLLPPASEFLKKGLSGKYISVFTCPNGQADFMKTQHISFIVNGRNTQEYAKLQRKCLSNL